MKKLLICLLALMLAAIPAFGEGTETGALEGPGFDSPEEAVTAYLEALKNGDVEGMLATFAIETYVAEMDAQAYLERMWAFALGDFRGAPVSDPYLRQIVVYQRQAELTNELYRQYLFYSWPEAYGEFSADALRLNGEAEVEAFLSALSASTFTSTLGSLEIVEFVEPAELSDMYLNERNQQTIARQAASYGCDELVTVAVKLDIGGEEWYQCMNVARYGEKWYNLSLSGNIGILLAMSSYAAGLAPASELRL